MKYRNLYNGEEKTKQEILDEFNKFIMTDPVKLCSHGFFIAINESHYCFCAVGYDKFLEKGFSNANWK